MANRFVLEYIHGRNPFWGSLSDILPLSHNWRQTNRLNDELVELLEWLFASNKQIHYNVTSVFPRKLFYSSCLKKLLCSGLLVVGEVLQEVFPLWCEDPLVVSQREALHHQPPALEVGQSHDHVQVGDLGQDGVVLQANWLTDNWRQK